MAQVARSTCFQMVERKRQMRTKTAALLVVGLCTCGFLLTGCSHDKGRSTSTDAAVREETIDLPGAEAKTTTAAQEEREASRSVTSDEGESSRKDESASSTTTTQSSEATAEREATQAAD
jgi:hypothetical protein